MTRCDVLVVGGGPAGSTCAWKLSQAGLDVLVIDRAVFPRDKPCAGWITPGVIEALALDLGEYRRARTFQPFTAFRVGGIDRRGTDVAFARHVSYGICRCEFDAYLLQRSRARTIEGAAVRRLERTDSGWRVNGGIEAALVVGAGGHFCPVARQLGRADEREDVVVAREAEIPLTPEETEACRIASERPQLYFCGDFLGYGWAIRKGGCLNVGLGREDRRHLTGHVDAFLSSLDPSISRVARRGQWRGHAYLLRHASHRAVAGEGFVLVGDAAGLAHTASGEGIGPAVVSGILAAETIVAAAGRYTATALAPYADLIEQRFPHRPAPQLASWLPASLRAAAGRQLLGLSWVARRVIEECFLRPGAPRAA